MYCVYITLREKAEDGTIDEANDIDFKGIYGQRLSELLENINARRPKDKKIIKLYNEFDQEIPLSHKVKGGNTFYHRA